MSDSLSAQFGAQFRAQFMDGLEKMGLCSGDLPIQFYLDYVNLLAQWNQAYNLTAIREPEKMLAYHVLDSLSILPFINEKQFPGNRFLDIGTGAGLPGIILALAKPETHWVLLDGNNKKTRFVNQAVIELKLNNVEVVCSRIEEYKPVELFSGIVSRAFTSLVDFYHHSHYLLANEGLLLAMKGPDPEKEIAELPEQAIVESVNVLHVPGVDGERSLVKLKPN